MESTTSTSQSNLITYSCNIKAYFYKDQDYYFVITSYDNNKLMPDERICLRVIINFIPEDFIEYEFEVIEATSSYFHLRNLLNDYYIIFVQDTNYESDIFSNRIVEINQENNIMEVVETTNESDDDLYYSDDSADGYDSEGYYFRVK